MVCSTLCHPLHSSYLYSSINSLVEIFKGNASSAPLSYVLYVDMLVYILNVDFLYNSSSLHTHTHTQAGWQTGQFGSVQFSWPPFEAASGRSEEHGCQEGGTSHRLLGGVGVTGVQAGLRRRGGAAVMGGCRRAVEGLRAPPQVLQGLQEGPTCPLLLQG